MARPIKAIKEILDILVLIIKPSIYLQHLFAAYVVIGSVQQTSHRGSNLAPHLSIEILSSVHSSGGLTAPFPSSRLGHKIQAWAEFYIQFG
jgi:hypothetical protein